MTAIGHILVVSRLTTKLYYRFGSNIHADHHENNVSLQSISESFLNHRVYFFRDSPLLDALLVVGNAMVVNMLV